MLMRIAWLSRPHDCDDFIGRHHCMREGPVIDHRGLVAVAPLRMPRRADRVLNHGNLEAPLEKLAQMSSTHMFASMPPRMIFLIPRLPSCRTTSSVYGPNTLCGPQTIVLPSSI